MNRDDVMYVNFFHSIMLTALFSFCIFLHTLLSKLCRETSGLLLLYHILIHTVYTGGGPLEPHSQAHQHTFVHGQTNPLQISSKTFSCPTFLQKSSIGSTKCLKLFHKTPQLVCLMKGF